MSEENTEVKKTVGELKTALANLYINRVSLSEVIQAARDLCVKAATEHVEKADEETLLELHAKVEEFEKAQGPRKEVAAEDEGEVKLPTED